MSTPQEADWREQHRARLARLYRRRSRSLTAILASPAGLAVIVIVEATRPPGLEAQRTIAAAAVLSCVNTLLAILTARADVRDAAEHAEARWVAERRAEAAEAEVAAWLRREQSPPD